MNLQINAQLLNENDAVAYYDEDTRTCYFGRKTAIYCKSYCMGMDPIFEMIIHILNHEVLHDVLNLHFGRETSLKLDNVSQGGSP